jgi:hypothetical protein
MIVPRENDGRLRFRRSFQVRSFYRFCLRQMRVLGDSLRDAVSFGRLVGTVLRVIMATVVIVSVFMTVNSDG